jgi:uncharacterized membrane-anchored protein
MKLKILIVVLALQSLWILGTAFVQERTLASGKVILLETRPVDPRDLLRGDYVRLNYKISNVPGNVFSPPLARELPAGTTVYIGLEQRGQFYEVIRAALEKFQPASGEVVVKGRSVSNWGSTNSVRIEYGLERYFVGEGKGNPRGKLTVRAAVPDSGQARIKEVLVDGKPYAEAVKGSDE